MPALWTLKALAPTGDQFSTQMSLFGKLSPSSQSSPQMMELGRNRNKSKRTGGERVAGGRAGRSLAATVGRDGTTAVKERTQLLPIQLSLRVMLAKLSGGTRALGGGRSPYLPWAGLSAGPRLLALRYLVCWLESCASLTRLCTSMSVLSLVPERSFSAPICSRTAERCSAVHFRTKGFRW